MSENEPVTLSMAWGIDPSAIAAIGAVDVTLNCDTNLFIDPLLLEEASNAAFRDCASRAYRERFEQLIDLLQASKAENDPAWRAARRMLKFHEIGHTHLGYSTGTGGSGFGQGLSDGMLATAKEVIDLGVENPDLFVALALFEDGVGADRISDMATNIILDCLASYTKDACDILGIATREHQINNRRYTLPDNPMNGDEPVLLVPKDIVRDLPVASDWASLSQAAQETQDLRDRANVHIGEIWRAKSREDKAAIRDNALRSKSAFETLLEILRNAADEPYDVEGDHRGEIYPAEIRQQVARQEPLDLLQYAGRKLTLEEANEVVVAIINQFQSLIEDKGLWREMWDDALKTPRLEKAMQRLFYAVATAYCEANDLDISPEANAGAGPVDFKISGGAKAKVLVELKRSLNPKLVAGYKSQLDAYRAAESTTRAHYLVIDVGGLTSAKISGLSATRSEVIKAGLEPSDVVYIDAAPQVSASKRK